MEGESEREKLDFSVALPSQDEERSTGTGGWREGGGRRKERGKRTGGWVVGGEERRGEGEYSVERGREREEERSEKSLNATLSPRE